MPSRRQISMRFGAVDAGSNSVRCLAVEWSKGTLARINSTVDITRLSMGVSKGAFSILPESLERTRKAVSKAADFLGGHGVAPGNMSLFATEGMRAAQNWREAAVSLESAAGVPLELLSGRDEGGLSREGALLGLGDPGMAVFDLGGGSLEIATPTDNVSLPLGAVRMTGLFGEDHDRIIAHSMSTIQQAGVVSGAPLAGVGGASSSVAMMLSHIPVEDYAPGLIHAKLVSTGDLQTLERSLRKLPVSERAKETTGLEPGRADIIVAGICVLEAVLSCWGAVNYTHSETGLLWGRCARLARAMGLAVARVEL